MYWLRVTEDILRVVTPFVAQNCSNIFATNGVLYACKAEPVLLRLQRYTYGIEKSSVDACDKMADHWIEPQR